MDGLSAAGSIVSLAAITGQLIESTKALYEFWTSVKEVPSRLQWLTEDLKCLQDTLDSIQQQSAQITSTVGVQNGRQALQRCSFHLQNLETLVAPFRTQIQDGRMRSVWRSIKAEFNAKKAEDFRATLEAAKASLILTQTAMTLQSDLTTKRGVASLLQEQKIAQETSTRENRGLHDQITTLGRERESILTTGRGVASLIIEQKAAGDMSTREYQGLHDQFAGLGLGRDVRMLADTSTSNIGEVVAYLKSTNFENMLSSIVQKTVREGLSKVQEARSPHQDRRCHWHDPGKERTRRISSRSATLENLPRSGSVMTRRKVISRRHFYTPFGIVIFRYYMVRRYRTPVRLCDEDHTFEFELTIVPRSFLLRKAASITGTWDSAPKFSLTGLHFQFHHTIDYNSTIFVACEDGDIATMKQLLQSKQASPLDVDKDGSGLLIKALEGRYATRLETCKFVLDAGCRGSAISTEDSYSALAYVITAGDYQESDGPYHEALDIDLDIMRLLVEKEGLEQIDGPSLLLGLLFRPFELKSSVTPALEYLWKQDLFEFNWSDVFVPSSDSPTIALPCFQQAPLSSFLRGFCACGGDVNMVVDDQSASPLMAKILFKYRHSTYNDERTQLLAFNDTVISFCLSLKYGLDPYAILLQLGDTSPNFAVSSSLFACTDPDFTGVAWRLALKLNGWILQDPEDDVITSTNNYRVDGQEAPIKLDWYSDETDQDDDSECAESRESLEIVSDHASDAAEEEGPRIPGAWIDHSDDSSLWQRRRFRSRFDDFIGCSHGVVWDEDLYLLPEDTRQKRAKEKIEVHWRNL